MSLFLNTHNPTAKTRINLHIHTDCHDDATQLGKPEAVLGPLLTAVFNMSQWLVKKIQSDGKHWIFTAYFCLNVLKRKVKPENSGFFQNYFFSYF